MKYLWGHCCPRWTGSQGHTKLFSMSILLYQTLLPNPKWGATPVESITCSPGQCSSLTVEMKLLMAIQRTNWRHGSQLMPTNPANSAESRCHTQRETWQSLGPRSTGADCANPSKWQTRAPHRSFPEAFLPESSALCCLPSLTIRDSGRDTWPGSFSHPSRGPSGSWDSVLLLSAMEGPKSPWNWWCRFPNTFTFHFQAAPLRQLSRSVSLSSHEGKPQCWAAQKVSVLQREEWKPFSKSSSLHRVLFNSSTAVKKLFFYEDEARYKDTLLERLKSFMNPFICLLGTKKGAQVYHPGEKWLAAGVVRTSSKR